ncbi:hypothetical protein F5884DRAFT_808793 [Xylogone sp. PMI_703]|nr:hypothetical protein F5884DRAFT_808793 [Xylogone sp. PMI_703]
MDFLFNSWKPTPVEPPLQDNSNATHHCEQVNITLPLLAAVENGNRKTVKLLLDHGADINFENEKAQTALFLAIETDDEYYDDDEGESLVEFLVKNGASVNHADESGQTPLLYYFLW